MTKIAANTLKLGLIGAIASLLLAGINFFTEPRIENMREEELQAALSVLSGGKSIGIKEENPAPRVARRWSLQPSAGWILELQGKGYGGNMTIVASFDEEGSVIAAKLLDNDETVGFGKKAEEEGYMDMFKGRGSLIAIPMKKSDADSDVISGATITFTGIAETLSTGSELVKEWSSL